MKCRQSIPEQWLIIGDDEIDRPTLRNLPRGAGVLLLRSPKAAQAARLRQSARERDLTVVEEGPGMAVRVHNIRELTQARLRGTRLILISPVHATKSHPDWKPLGRMRAATLARLAGPRAIALGGMDEKRFAGIRQLGFVAWAGISRWREAAVRKS